MMEIDKLIERARYEARAQSQMKSKVQVTEMSLGSQNMPAYLRSPYNFYELKISELIRPNHRVLELGAGVGMHTWSLLQTGANVIASDISPNSLSVLNQRYQRTNGNLKTEIADMESLPFEASSFDVITSAGSLSYGEPHVVDAEIKRVLRPGGVLICVDSLNHNPIYRLNRWVHYCRGDRTRSTLQRMPDLARLSALSSGFSDVNVRYFGAFSFAMPVIAWLTGEVKAQVISDRLDALMGVKRSAFKFVLVAQGLR